MGRNVVEAKSVNRTTKNEHESISAEVNVDVAVVLPSDISPDARLELQYDVITKAVNDYIERYTIDARIDKVNYNLSTPALPDNEATDNLNEALTGAKTEIITSEGEVLVDNSEINDEKVNLKFELSVEENVYLDSADDTSLKEDSQPQKKNPPTKEQIVSPNTEIQHKGDLIIQSAEPKLYWQNAPKKELYWQNAPAGVSKKSILDRIKISDKTIDTGVEAFNIVGSGIGSAMTNDTLNLIKLGDNKQIYTNPFARGNKYYKIVGTVSDHRVVKGLGTAGKAISYGTTIYKAGKDLSKAQTSQEKGRVVGATAGKVGAGTLAGTVASAATTAALVTIAGVAGVAAAPVTLVVIAGCSIVAGVAASSAVEGIGEEIGGNFGVWAVDKWQSRTKK